MEFSRSIIRKTYSLKRSMQHFFNTDHLSREKGFRCHKTRYRFWDRVTLLHFQIWPHGMEIVIKYHERSNDPLPCTLNRHWRSGCQPGKSLGRMESVSSRLRRFLTLSADEISQNSGVNKHLLLWSLNRQTLDRLHSMLFIIERKHSQRLPQIESETAWLNSPPIVLYKESTTAL